MQLEIIMYNAAIVFSQLQKVNAKRSIQSVNSFHIMNSIELLTKSLVGWVSRQSGQNTLIECIKISTQLM